MKIDKKELLVSTVKSVFGEVPLIGTALDEIIFEYSGRLKQKRLNRFVEIIAESITEESEVNLDNIQKENFIDLFESVLRRVVLTKSELKLNRFKDIIVNELTSPSQQIEVIELYLDLVSTLTEEEIAILYNHKTLKYLKSFIIFMFNTIIHFFNYQVGSSKIKFAKALLSNYFNSLITSPQVSIDCP